MAMKKSLKIFLISIIIILIVLGVLSYLFTGRIIPSSSCGNDFNNQFSNAIVNNNLDFCSSFNGHIDYSKDIYSTYYCRVPKTDVVGNILRDDFRNSCLQTIGVSMGNATACQLMSAGQMKIDECLLFVSRKVGNNKSCNLIKDEVLKAQCLVGSNKDATTNISACNTITSESARDACIAHYSKRVGNKDYCSMITDQELKSYCLK